MRCWDEQFPPVFESWIPIASITSQVKFLRGHLPLSPIVVWVICSLATSEEWRGIICSWLVIVCRIYTRCTTHRLHFPPQSHGGDSPEVACGILRHLSRTSIIVHPAGTVFHVPAVLRTRDACFCHLTAFSIQHSASIATPALIQATPNNNFGSWQAYPATPMSSRH